MVRELLSTGDPQFGAKIYPLDRYQNDVWSVSPTRTQDLKTIGPANMPNHRQKEHPAVFPVEIPRALAAFLTNRGETILDPFAGAGTTILAAEQLGRRARALELEPVYCDISLRRWEEFTGREALKL